MRLFAALHPSVATGHVDAHPAELRLFLTSMKQCSVLGIASTEVQALLDSIAEMPGDIQLLWTQVLQTRLSRTDLTILDHGTNSGCRLPAPRSRATLQIADASPAVCGTCGSPHEAWKEFAGSAAIRACSAQQAANTIPRGTSRSDLYRENFQSVARITDNCVIVDRFAGVRLVRRADRSGVAWLGEQLVRDGVQRVVLVTGDKNTSTNDIQQAASQLGSAPLRRALRLEVRPDADFARCAHDRFILLQAGRTGCTYSIGKGVEVFESTSVLQESSFSSSDGPVVARLLGDLRVNVAPHFV